MAKIKVGINGFGRIGRMTFRAILLNPNVDVEVVAINDLTSPDMLAHLLKYDSVHRTLDAEVSHGEGCLIVNGQTIKVLSERDPANLGWGVLGVDVVLECTGLFTNAAKAKAHLQAGAKKVIISAPATDEDITMAIGINTDSYNPDAHHIISNASCTTNCLAPIAKVLHEAFGIEHGLMNTIHSYTGDQRLIDAPHSDFRRARSAPLSMIPSSTGAAKAIGLVLPELKGKLHGLSVRVPTPDVSLVDLTFVSKKPVTVEAINAAMQAAADGALKGVLEYNADQLVSSDFVGNAHSSIYDPTMTCIMGDNLVKVAAWYDNEWGYSNRLAELTQFVASKLPIACSV
jgi:glyceraldehyde 3-phosphate dehydrogenase